jgi:hypothetical protein
MKTLNVPSKLLDARKILLVQADSEIWSRVSVVRNLALRRRVYFVTFQVIEPILFPMSRSVFDSTKSLFIMLRRKEESRVNLPRKYAWEVEIKTTTNGVYLHFRMSATFIYALRERKF